MTDNLFATDPPKPKKKPRNITDETAQSIYALYPKKVGKKAAIKAIKSAARDLLKEGNTDPVQALLDATREYRNATMGWPDGDRQYIPHPSTWFNQGHYEDDPNEWYKGERKRPAPTAKILNQWQDGLKQAINAVTNAPSERQMWQAQASLKTFLSRIPDKLKSEPSIAAAMEHAGELLL